MGLSFIIDTSAYSHFDRGDVRLKQFINPGAEIHLPLTVIAEVRGGSMYGTQHEVNEHKLRKFIDSPRVTVLTPTLKTTELYGQIYATLRRSGKPIGTNDIWIAALALEHNLPLLTTDKDFRCVPKLELL